MFPTRIHRLSIVTTFTTIALRLLTATPAAAQEVYVDIPRDALSDPDFTLAKIVIIGEPTASAMVFDFNVCSIGTFDSNSSLPVQRAVLIAHGNPAQFVDVTVIVPGDTQNPLPVGARISFPEWCAANAQFVYSDSGLRICNEYHGHVD